MGSSHCCEGPNMQPWTISCEGSDETIAADSLKVHEGSQVHISCVTNGQKFHLILFSFLFYLGGGVSWVPLSLVASSLLPWVYLSHAPCSFSTRWPELNVLFRAQRSSRSLILCSWIQAPPQPSWTSSWGGQSQEAEVLVLLLRSTPDVIIEQQVKGHLTAHTSWSFSLCLGFRL